MNETRYKLERLARFKFNSLSPDERDGFEAMVSRLQQLPVEKWPAAGAKKFVGHDSNFILKGTFYVIPVDDSLRALIRPTEEGVMEVLDFFPQESVDLFAASPSGKTS